MKIGMKEEMGVANEMTSSVLGLCVRSACNFCAKRTNSLIFMFWGEKLQLELSEGHENWHEGGDGCCRQKENLLFWFVSTHRVHSTRICSQEARKSTRFLGMGRKKELESS